MRSTVLVRAVSAYAFSQLSLFHKVTNSILQIDNHIMDLQQKLGVLGGQIFNLDNSLCWV